MVFTSTALGLCFWSRLWPKVWGGGTTIFKELPLITVLILSLLFRLYNLDSLPAVVNGDESGSLIHPIQILFAPRLNLFSLTHDYSVSYIIYLPKALALSIFGQSHALFAARLVTVFFSLGTLMGFYLLIRRHVSPLCAFLATLLLSTNIIFLSFSRVSWINMDSAFFSIWLFYFLDNYLDRYLVPLIICGAALLFEYMGGRAFLLSLPIFFVAQAIQTRSFAHLNRLAVITMGIFLVFLPQLKEIINQPDLYFRRAQSVFIFESPRQISSPLWKTLSTQTVALIRGLFIFDPAVSRLSIENQRLLPPLSSGLSPILAAFYVSGIFLVMFKNKGHRFWLVPLSINLLLIQFSTTLIPSWGRALPVFPVIFLFIAISLNTLLEKFPSLRVARMVVALMVFGLSLSGLAAYFGWVNQPEFVRVNEPVIRLSHFPLWLQWQKNYVQKNAYPFDAYYWQKTLLPRLVPQY